MIRKFTKIENLNSFDKFVWKDHDLPCFKRYNLIYGWNGSGKSTISEAFRDNSDRPFPSEEQFKFEMEGGESKSVEVLLKDNNKVYVFNSHRVGDFIKNVSKGGDGEKAVHVLGEENVILSEQITEKEEFLIKSNEDLVKVGQNKKDGEKEFAQFCAGHAKEIKDILTKEFNVSDDPYIRFNQRDYKDVVEKRKNIIDTKSDEEVLKEKVIEVRNALKEVVSGGDTYNEPIGEIVWESAEALSNLEEKISEALELSPVNKAIDTLKENPEIETWAKEGWRLHKKSLPGTSDGEQQIAGVGEEITCQFCDNIISAERLNALQQHFSDAYYNAVGEIQKVLNEVEGRINPTDDLLRSKTLSLDEGRINLEVRAGWTSEVESVKGTLVAYKEYLKRAKEVLTEKEKNPTRTPTKQLLERALVSFDSINELLKRHNQAVGDYEQTRKGRIENLVNCMADVTIFGYNLRKNQIDEYSRSIENARVAIENTERTLKHLKSQRRDDKRALVHLNKLIEGCFNYGSLYFEPAENGDKAAYRLMRKNLRAVEAVEDNLSDGERSTIAFLYFLITLHDKDVSLKNSIVIIDDPMSNMDYSNSAIIFSLIMEYTKNAKQIFILTHRYDIFRQLKRHLFHRDKGEQPKKGQEKVKLYDCYLLERGEKGSSFAKLPAMLLKYDSEYGFLFHEVYRIKKEVDDSISEDEDAKRLYYVANMSRKLLEHFLEFRAPHERNLLKAIGSFKDKVRGSAKGGGICLTAIYEYLNAASHMGANFDNLIGAKHMCENVMQFIELVDKEHYEHMEEICKKAEKESAQETGK